MKTTTTITTALRLLPVLALTAVAAGPAWAVGFRFPHQDPDSIARANAFVATADNPSAVYYNPAGITQLEGQHFSAGLYLASMGIDFTSALGGSASSDSDVQFVPQLHYVLTPKGSNWSFGLGINAPYGLGIDYGDDTPFADIATRARLVYLSVSPVVACRITPTLSLAAGATINYSDAELENNPLGAEFEFEGDGWDLGFNLGLLWQPHHQWSFGLMYRSQTEINFEGKSRLRPLTGWTNTEAEVTFPMFLDLGVSYRPNDKWNLEFNLDWTDWDSVNTTTFKGTFPSDTDFPFNYKSGFIYEFGVTRYLDHGFHLSAGYAYSENSVPEESLSPFNPDSNLHLGSVGLGRRTDRWSWSVAYHFAYNPGRTITHNDLVLANGEWETFNHGLNLAVRYAF